MNKNILIIITLLIILAIAGFILSRDSNDDMTKTSRTEDNMTDTDNNELPTDVTATGSMDTPSETTITDPSKGNIGSDSVMSTETKGSFETYDLEKLALADSGDVVLFFHASWCPTCRSLASNITENIASIPLNTHILKVDYDSETKLKQKYGVTYQHTLVQVDSQGNLIKKWTGSPSLASLLSEVQ